MRWSLGIAGLILALSGAAYAETAPAPAAPAVVAPTTPATDALADAPWQAAVTSQIEAFRIGDGEAALKFAAASFKATYSDPKMFYAAILSGGYEPIVKSRSHTFGKFTKLDDKTVLQVVRLVGPEQGLFEALYQLGLEDDGWHVQGVALKAEKGVGI